VHQPVGFRGEVGAPGAEQLGLDGLQAAVAGRDLRSIDPERLRTATEELVLRLQAAAPLLDLKRPALEADAR